MAGHTTPFELDDIAADQRFCLRCECTRPTVRRVNSVGAALFGNLVTIGAPLGVYGFFAIAEKQGAPTAIVVAFALALTLGTALIALIKGPGPARVLVCASCEDSDLLPLDSPRARRLLAEQSQP